MMIYLMPMPIIFIGLFVIFSAFLYSELWVQLLVAFFGLLPFIQAYLIFELISVARSTIRNVSLCDGKFVAETFSGEKIIMTENTMLIEDQDFFQINIWG
ncbi:hypothetical protein ACPV5L_05880 [Vibrio astriarenae]